MNRFWRILLLLLGLFFVGTGIGRMSDHAYVKGFLLILLGAGCMAPQIASLLAAPFTAFIDSVFLPGGRSGKPPANLALPAFYRKEERYGEALAEYRKIIRYHPEEIDAWTEAIELLLDPLGDTDEAKKLYRKGLRRFRGKTDETLALENAWQRGLEALASAKR